MSLIKPAEHALEIQETMKQHAMAHFVNAAKFGVLSNARKDLVDTPTRCFWNAAIGFMASSISRQVNVSTRLCGANQRVRYGKDVGKDVKCVFASQVKRVTDADVPIWATTPRCAGLQPPTRGVFAPAP